MTNVYLTLQKAVILFSRVAELFCIPAPQSPQHLLLSLKLFRPFEQVYSSNSRCFSVFISLMTNDVQRHFMCLFTSCISSSVDCLFKYFVLTIFYCLFFFGCFDSSLYILDMSVRFINIFYPVCSLCFHFLHNDFDRANPI